MAQQGQQTALSLLGGAEGIIARKRQANLMTPLWVAFKDTPHGKSTISPCQTRHKVHQFDNFVVYLWVALWAVSVTSLQALGMAHPAPVAGTLSNLQPRSHWFGLGLELADQLASRNARRNPQSTS